MRSILGTGGAAGHPIRLQDVLHHKQVVRHSETDLPPGKGEDIAPLRTVVVGGAGILGQDADEAVPQGGGDPLQKRRGKRDVKGLPGMPVGESAGGLRVAVAVAEIGLDVIDGGAVHEIRPGDVEQRPQSGVKLHPLQPHGGQADGVGAEGGAGGKDPYAGIPAQPGRTDRGGPLFPDSLGELPQKPDMGKILQSPHRVGVSKFRHELDHGLQAVHQAALPGDAELGGKVGVDMGDMVHRSLVHDALPSAAAPPDRLKSKGYHTA